MKFRKIPRNDGRFAYAPQDGLDFALLFEPGSVTPPLAGDEIDAKTLFEIWNAAAIKNGRRQRALLFFPLVTLPKLSGYLQRAIDGDLWDVFVYWLEGDPASHFEVFPSGREQVIKIQQFVLTFAVNGEVVTPLSLDGLDVIFNAEKEQLEISQKNTEWRVRQVGAGGYEVATSAALTIRTTPHVGPDEKLPVYRGSLRVGVERGVAPKLPFGIQFSRLADTHNGFFSCSHEITAKMLADLDGPCFLALDPRDAPTLRIHTQSHMEFPGSTGFLSNILNDKGLRLFLGVRPGLQSAYARLKYEVNGGFLVSGRIKPRTNSIVFAPEGEFVMAGIEGIATEAGSLGGEAHKIMLGDAGTEYTPMHSGDALHFLSSGGGVLVYPTDLPPKNAGTESAVSNDEQRTVPFHDADGFITTSWVTTRPKNGSSPLVAETKGNALFNPPVKLTTETVSEPAALERKNLEYGAFGPSSHVPMVPWAGVKTTGLESSHVDFVPEFETTHFSRARRTILEPPPGAAALTEADKTGTPGVTPQGILAEVDEHSMFTKLYFGDPEPPASGRPASEFVIVLDRGGAAATSKEDEFYRDLQHALRADNLFLVSAAREEYTKRVFQPKAKVGIHQFELELRDQSLEGSVLVIKYFRGQSLEQLLTRLDLWVCRKDLAPHVTDDTRNKFIEETFKIDDPTKVIPEPLNAIFHDANWQGVLMLNLEPKGMPDLLEALRPGMVGEKLRVHHFGLNALPVSSKQIEVNPKRAGSAFGLLQYQKPPSDKQKPESEILTPPRATDSQPGGEESPDQNPRAYKFEVQLLKLEFSNSHISKFTAHVDVTFSHLFWSENKKKPADPVQLNGSYECRPVAQKDQPDGKKTEDIFTLRSTQVITIDLDGFLNQFIISRAELLVTNIEKDEEGKVTRLTSFLGFNAEAKFDDARIGSIIDVDKVTIERLGLEYTREGSDFSCKFKADSVRADIKLGDARKSLLSILPLEIKGFRIAINDLLDLGKLGFLPIFSQGREGFHFAFDLELDLGFLGKLSGPGKGLRLPLLLGWRGGKFSAFGGLGLGIQFPNWNGTDFEIGLQQFVAVKAKRARLERCPSGGGPPGALAIVLSEARLVFFGKEWPDEIFDFAIFLKTQGDRKVTWAFGLKPGNAIKYLGAGQRIVPPAERTAKDLIAQYDTILNNTPKQDKPEEADPCKLIHLSQPEAEGWLVLTHFEVSGLFEAWLGIADVNGIYALHLEAKALKGLGVEAMYRRVTDDLGIFSAEISGLFPPLQFGAATVKLPAIRVEVHTDGGFLVDLGFPWKNDFARSCQVEVAIFLGSGGFYFGRTSAAAVSALQLDRSQYGFDKPKLEAMSKFRALRAGFCFRVGLGRSIDLGILHGEVSITLLAGLEGAIAYGSDNSPSLYSVSGKVGIMAHIWAEVHFVILTARIDICVYAMVGFEMRRVLALNPTTNQHHLLTLPCVIFAEIGIYIRLELQIKIGCIVVTFVCQFSATWRFEHEIGGFRDGGAISFTESGQLLEGEESGLLEAVFVPHHWSRDFRMRNPAVTGVETVPQVLTLFATILPCAALPADVPGSSNARPFEPCVVVQLCLLVDTGLRAIAEFLVAAALGITDTSTATVFRRDVVNKCKALQDPGRWAGAEADALRASLQSHFAIEVRSAAELTNPAPACAVVPLWPGVQWRYHGAKTASTAMQVQIEKEHGAATPGLTPADAACFMDYLRAVTVATLTEIDRVINDRAQPTNGSPADAALAWTDLWTALTTKTTTP
jgi:hypothetical protein